MSLKLGIVGLPNVGKSTLFKALTKVQVDTSNYPFCTIDPNVGVVAVPDERLQKLAELSHSEKIIPAAIEFVDIAGLVAGAHKGEGLGNQFLSHIRQVDAIIHVVRTFSDSNVTHVHGAVDPKHDIEVINLELIMADLQQLERAGERLEKLAKGHDAEAARTKTVVDRMITALQSGQMASTVALDPLQEEPLIRNYNLLTRKPILYVVNVDEDDVRRDIHSFLKADTALQHAFMISAKIEAELAELPEVDAQAMMKELGMHKRGLDQLITVSYQLLNLISFFTTGPKETRAWTIPQGTLAPQAAGIIHTDFEQGFIRAEVVAYTNFVEGRGSQGAKTRGHVRMEGKEYVVYDGDVVLFHFQKH